MEIKKNPKYDLERFKSLFLEIGLVISLALIFTAFEWRKYDKDEEKAIVAGPATIIEEDVQITREAPPPPPAPEPQTTELEIVDDDIEVQNDIDIDAESTQDDEVGDFVAPIDEGGDVEIVETEVFLVVEEAPSFPGGEEALMTYLGNNIKYPQLARESNIQGIVYVSFIVEANGSISNVKLARGIGGGCDDEAVRVVKDMPKWNPGKQRGKPVRVQFNLPVRFILH